MNQVRICSSAARSAESCSRPSPFTTPSSFPGSFIDSFSPNAAELEMKVVAKEGWDGRADFAALKAMTFGNRPVIVLETDYLYEGPDFRKRATNIIVAEAPQYSHVVGLEVPGLIYETIRVAIGALRAGGALPACAATPIARLVERCA